MQRGGTSGEVYARQCAMQRPPGSDSRGTLSVMAGQDQDADVRSAAIARLTQINLDDLVSSFGWQDRPLISSIARRLLRNPAQKFAHQIVEFDTAVGRDGLASAARNALSNYVRDVRVFGRDHIPAGPFLALANHPGMSDALSLFGALNRPDLLVVASQRPFLRALPHTSRLLSCLSDEPFAHAAAIRKVSKHLRAGGAALSFPAGQIEPDPLVHGSAAGSLASWAQSAGVFVRLAPETAILPVVVRGVVWSKMAHRWPAQEKTAAALQLLANIVLKIRPVSVSVEIGRPIYASDLGTTSTQVLHQAVLAGMSHLIRNPSERDGEPLE